MVAVFTIDEVPMTQLYSPELRRLIEFAATDAQFAQMLITDAPTALQGEIFGTPFNLLPEEKWVVVSIRARNLLEFADMLAYHIKALYREPSPDDHTQPLVRVLEGQQVTV